MIKAEHVGKKIIVGISGKGDVVLDEVCAIVRGVADCVCTASGCSMAMAYESILADVAEALAESLKNEKDNATK